MAESTGAGPGSLRRKAAAAAVAAVAGAVSVWITFTFSFDSQRDEPVRASDPIVVHPPGGTVRVAVSTPPELSDLGDGGATLKQLTRPQLFVGYPDGSWRSSLVKAGSDRLSSNERQASFELNDARWSNGAPISADDLRRTADPRFVRSVDGPDDGRITVRFTQELPEWRFLWSGSAFIDPPAPELSGGPFVVSNVESGRGVTLVRNPQWFAGRSALDEVRLLVVPQAGMARQLLAAGDVDVVKPPAESGRTSKLSGLPDVTVSVEQRGGAVSVLRMNRARLIEERRIAIAAELRNQAFVQSLLRDEAVPLRAFDKGSALTGSVPDKGTRLDGFPVPVSVANDEPLSPVLNRMIANAVDRRGGLPQSVGGNTTDVRNRMRSGQWGVVLDDMANAPSVCWRCSLSGVNDELVKDADSGDSDAADELQRRARKEGDIVPLWRAYTVTAVRKNAVDGVVPNGFTSGVAWNAGQWWRP